MQYCCPSRCWTIQLLSVCSLIKKTLTFDCVSVAASIFFINPSFLFPKTLAIHLNNPSPGMHKHTQKLKQALDSVSPMKQPSCRCVCLLFQGFQWLVKNK